LGCGIIPTFNSHFSPSSAGVANEQQDSTYLRFPRPSSAAPPVLPLRDSPAASHRTQGCRELEIDDQTLIYVSAAKGTSLRRQYFLATLTNRGMPSTEQRSAIRIVTAGYAVEL